jgi:hypothetical protein
MLPQGIWWISSIIRLQDGLVTDIDNLRIPSHIGRSEELRSISNTDPHVHPSRIARINSTNSNHKHSMNKSVRTSEADIHNEVIENCERLFKKQSEQERKAIGRGTRQASRIIKKNAEKPIRTYGTQTEGIDGSEFRRRKAASEYQRYASPRE